VTTVRTELSSEPTVLPASFAQQRLWFLDQLEGDAGVYNVPAGVRLRGLLDVGRLERAINVLVERHESLRTAFTLVDGVPHQVIRPQRPVSLAVVDLCDAEDAEQRAVEAATEQARKTFDLSADELFRVALIKLGDEDHLLSLTLHHIITDAWSIGVLRRELSALYAGFVEGDDVKLPELPIQYADYAVWQQRWMESGGLDQQLHYWRTQLAGAPTLLQLATDRPRPAAQSFRGATVTTMLPPGLLERVRTLGDDEGATLFMTLLSALAVLLSRYSSQEDVVIASPIANRSRVEIENVIGLFVNTLALRLDVKGDQSFVEIVRQARETALGAFANQDLPFEKLVEELNPERHLSHAPVAQVLLVVNSGVERPVPFPGLVQEPISVERGTAKFDLSFFAAETAEGLRLSLEYCSDLFEEATALRMLEHCRALLEAAVADPACSVGELGLLNERERETVLGRWNETEQDYPLSSQRPVHELVAEQAGRSPDLVAVQCAREALSYAELEVRANQLARHLRELGVRPGVVVAICAERSAEMVIALLAVLKAGGAYAPIDPAYPRERVEFMLADTDAPVLLTQQHLLTGLPRHRARTVCLSADQNLTDSHDGARVPTEATLDDLGYVIYTSGSTGKPKGVAMGHRPLANLLAWQLGSFSEPVAARTLQFASLSFDVAFQEIFSTWCSGGTLVMIDEAVRRDPEALLAFVSEQRVERLFLPFVALQSLCEAAAHLGATIPTLREVITAGEQLKITEAICGFFARHASCALVNQYGPTESHVVTAFTLAGASGRWPALPPIGRPIANAKVYLLDHHQQPVPIGVPGELYIGGASLARGYLNRPELTRQRFVPDPFSEDPDARLYRTGDRARYLADGNIDYIGRCDDQMKIRGFRVEPGEIEAALRRHPGVHGALVMAREDDASGKRLVAYIISEPRATSADDLHRLLRRTLPDYMIPSAFVFLERFPLTPSGKVDRAALPPPARRGDVSGEHVAPRTWTERRLADIWTKVLETDEIGIYENFFELGGHSLMAVRLFAHIERRLGVRLPLSALFENATIAGLAELLERERAVDRAEWPSLVRLRPGNGQTPLFLVSWADGELLPWRELIENLNSGLPVFGLRAPGVDGVTRPIARVEDLAAHYVESIRRVQPHGPYRLGGYCFSGLVAYEIARVLREEHEDVGLLALIDAYPKQPSQPDRPFEVTRTRFRALRDADLLDKVSLVANYFAKLHIKVRYSAYERVGPRLFELLESRNLQHFMPRRPLNPVYVASNLARQRYVPRPLDARVEFFRGQTVPDSRPTPWDTLAGRGVRLRQVVAPGIDHVRLMHEPHVRLLAAEIMSALDEPVR
jgi:amino acid adenylation domain-containing protein